MKLTVQEAKEGVRVRVYDKAPYNAGRKGTIQGESRGRDIYLRSPRSWRVPVQVGVLLDGDKETTQIKVSDLQKLTSLVRTDRCSPIKCTRYPCEEADGPIPEGMDACDLFKEER